MAYGEKPQLTPGRLTLIIASLVLLTGVTVWHLFYREIPSEPRKPSGPLVIEFNGDTMGTYYVVKVYPARAEDMPTAPKMEEAVRRELQDVDSKMSTYQKDSELSRFNQWHSKEPFEFSEDTFEVIRLSQQISEQTGGAFDITVGPLVNAWGFGPDGLGEAPDDEELAQLRERVGYRLLELDPVARTVAKRNPDIYCDLSAVAKGYAVDRIAMALDDLGAENYMIEVGGEVRTSGRNAEGQPWQIGIEVPNDAVGGVHRVVPLSGLAMATSGDYRNHYERDGVTVSHTIDPRTGRPVPHVVASVSVVHHECAYADALATALVVLGPDDGIEFADEIGLPVLYLIHSGDSFDERTSDAFTTLL